MLLAALHSHCMHLLTQAQEQLPAEACLFRGSTSKHSSQDSAAGSFGGMQLPPGEQQQHQQLAWQLCCAQVQHDLLLVLQLTEHCQHHNQVVGLEHMHGQGCSASNTSPLTQWQHICPPPAVWPATQPLDLRANTSSDSDGKPASLSELPDVRALVSLLATSSAPCGGRKTAASGSSPKEQHSNAADAEADIPTLAVSPTGSAAAEEFRGICALMLLVNITSGVIACVSWGSSYGSIILCMQRSLRLVVLLLLVCILPQAAAVQASKSALADPVANATALPVVVATVAAVGVAWNFYPVLGDVDRYVRFWLPKRGRSRFKPNISRVRRIAVPVLPARSAEAAIAAADAPRATGATRQPLYPATEHAAVQGSAADTTKTASMTAAVVQPPRPYSLQACALLDQTFTVSVEGVWQGRCCIALRTAATQYTVSV